MDAAERLSIDEVSAPTLLSAHHLHRYAFAARLCRNLRVLDLACGVGYGSAILAERGAASVEGVDIAQDAIDEARRAYGDRPGLRFRVGDALGRLHEMAPSDFDAIVAFEALEHLPHLDATVERLRALRAAGVQLILSVPNSRTFHEQNEFHLTDFGYDEALRTFGDLADATFLYQHVAEGSIIVGDEVPRGFAGDVSAIERAEPEYANTFVVAAGFAADAVQEATAQLNVVATPNHNRFMLETINANHELWRTNLRLSRGWLGKSDAAAASMQLKFDGLTQRIAELEARVVELDGIARHNDELFQRERMRMTAPRYRAVDKLRDAVVSIPFLGRTLRWAWRVVTGTRKMSR